MQEPKLWLKVSNARRDGKEDLWIQVEGDRGDREPSWWPLDPGAAGKDSSETFRAILDGIDKKRLVLVLLECTSSGKTASGAPSLRGSTIRIQHAESRPV